MADSKQTKGNEEQSFEVVKDFGAFGEGKW